MRSISLIIPCHNEEKSLLKTFKRLDTLKIPAGIRLAEVIFVDNGSRDRTFLKLSTLAQNSPLPISIVSYKKRLGQKSAAMEGVKCSATKYNLILNPNLSNFTKELAKLSSKSRKPRKTKRKRPLVSVIMPVYNSQERIDKAIQSVLNQTFKDFELIIIDDHSSDKNWDIIKRYEKKSKKIRAFRNSKKLGIPVCVKLGVAAAVGDYITKIDSNDLCYKTRFERQVKVLNKNKRTVAVGTQYLFLTEKGTKFNKKIRPLLLEKAYEYIHRFLPVQKPALMIAKKRLPRGFEFYNYESTSLEDAELVYKLSKYGRVENLPYTLLRYRIEDDFSLLSTLRKIYFLFYTSFAKGTI